MKHIRGRFVIMSGKIAAIAIIMFCFSQIGMAQDIPSCEDLGGIQQTTNDLLEGGYPRQQFINQTEIVVHTSEPCYGAFVFTDVFDNGVGLLVEDALFTFESTWQKVDVSKREPITGVEGEFEFSRSNEISTSIAAEMAIGFSVEATGGFKPIGIGGELTLGSSIEFSLALERGVANATEVSHSFPVRPGEEVQLWGRQINVNVEWTNDDYSFITNPKDIFAMGQDFVRELYLPSLEHNFVIHNKMTEEAAEATAAALAIIYIANWPPQNDTDTLFATNALELYNEFIEDYPEEGYKASYKIPAKEIYPSRYFYSTLATTPVPATPVPTTPIPTDNTVNSVAFGDGSGVLGNFRQNADGTWSEDSLTEQNRFRFNEVGRDANSIYLNDPSRNMNIELDLANKEVKWDGQLLYFIFD